MSWSKLVITRRSTVLSLPLQQDFPAFEETPRFRLHLQICQGRQNALAYSLDFSNGDHSNDRTPFDEEDWDDHIDPLEDDGRPGKLDRFF
jgi:hypothetical protein